MADILRALNGIYDTPYNYLEWFESSDIPLVCGVLRCANLATTALRRANYTLPCCAEHAIKHAGNDGFNVNNWKGHKRLPIADDYCPDDEITND